ncbi:hypothetical protein, conserved [Eimeria brunetti]|uniref:Uncharacterized protein n=1 Tax=Eimeria brunetti TaxID=51314 RepID=U6LRW9_9EIME|nr:hypothetical protein, conserved [Eimeria brunetti]
MELVVGDHSGLCKELSFVAAETRRTRIIKRAKQDRSLAVTALCWGGSSDGKEVSEIAVGRADGSVEAFATSNVICEVPLPEEAVATENSLQQPLRSFQLPSTPVALSLIGSRETRAYTRSLLCKSWLASGVTAGEASLRTALLPPSTEAGATPEEDPACSSSSSRLLLAVGQKGHACVVEWEGCFSTRLLETSSDPGEGLASPDGDEAASAVEGEPADVSVQFLPIEKDPKGELSAAQTVTEYDSFCCRAAYLLPGPIAAASSHPLCHSLLAFGGRENDAKVVDLDYGKTLWCAKNVKPSFLGLRCDVAVTQIDWLLPIHPMVLAVGTAKGAMRFYDLRCQRRPVLEVCEATQEKRPVTALHVRPTDEVLQNKTHVRVALARAAEVAASCYSCKAGEADTSATAANGESELSEDKGSPELPDYSSCKDGAATEAAHKLLAGCSGKESATLYYADSYGKIYGIGVHSGAAMLRLVDKNCPKYNPSSCRSGSDIPEPERTPEVKRKLIAAMLDKQRARLSSKKNDHPLSAAACVELQLATAPIGGFKGAMGAILGLGLDPAGERLFAVGLGRYVYVFDAKSRKLSEQVFLKQKLTCLLGGGGEAAGGIRRQSPTSKEAASEGSNSESDASSSTAEEDDDSDTNNSTDSSSTTEDSKQKAGRQGDKQPARATVPTNKRKIVADDKSKRKKRLTTFTVFKEEERKDEWLSWAPISDTPEQPVVKGTCLEASEGEGTRSKHQLGS